MGSSFGKSEVTDTVQKVTSAVDSNTFYDEFIKDLVKKNSIVVFSRTNCGYCIKAKNLLKNMNLPYQSIELDVNQQCPQENCQKLSTALVLQTRMRTVPQIFINGKLIGGFTDLQSITQDTEKFKEFFESKN